MTRVKMNAKQEYEYLTNFKVLQNIFKNKKIDKVRRVDCPQPQPSHELTKQLLSLAVAYPYRVTSQV